MLPGRRARRSPAASVAPVDGHGLKILVAEGNRLLADALSDLFSELNGGLPVLTASTVGETLDVAARELPDLVIIDHWIGRGSVDVTVREILRRSPRSSVVVMATGVDEPTTLKMRSAGASRCVEKDDVVLTARSILESVDRP